MNPIRRVSVSIRGRVQGVLFRRGVAFEARKFGLVGFTRNEPDGSVIIIAEGRESNLRLFLDFCYKGTALSQVSGLEFRWLLPIGEFNEFSVVRSGGYVADKIRALRNLSKRAFSLELPKHVAIIPDGNRRWARMRDLPSIKGHEQGLSNAISLLEEAFRMKIPYVTLWGFSTENWKREALEVRSLIDLFNESLKTLRDRLLKNRVSFRHFGRRDRFPKSLLSNLVSLEKETTSFDNGSVGLALDYGGRDEIIRALQRLRGGGDEISEKAISETLDTRGFPDPDLVIRTGGQIRTSGLMPWQSAYSEFHFAEEAFPDFDALKFREAIAAYSVRRRNFGK